MSVKNYFLALVMAIPFFSLSQTILNGSFTNYSSNWGCNPETWYGETSYGGTISSNIVAEVDAQVGLCQTVSGFTPGVPYVLIFDCSRRTNCGPLTQGLNVEIDGTVVKNVSRTGTPFNWTEERVDFIATSSSHTFEFDGTTSGTCGLLVDNITLVSALPAELVGFSVECAEKSGLKAMWQTASERNVDYFDVEETLDGVTYKSLGTVVASGNSTELLSYELALNALKTNKNRLFRLKTVDFDGKVEYSDQISVSSYCDKQNGIITSISSQGTNYVIGVAEQAKLKVVDVSGRVFFDSVEQSKNFIVSTDSFSNGMYYIVIESGNQVKQISRLPIMR